MIEVAKKLTIKDGGQDSPRPDSISIMISTRITCLVLIISLVNLFKEEMERHLMSIQMP